jgi:hypothetical protein
MDFGEETSQTISLCIACSPSPPFNISEGREELLTHFTYINSYITRAQFTALYDYLVTCV